MLNWKESGRNWSQLKIPCNLVGGYQLEHIVSIISMKVTHVRKVTGQIDEVGEKWVTEDRSSQSEPGTERTWGLDIPNGVACLEKGNYSRTGIPGFRKQ
jgi:hypothetical protein